MGSNRKKSKATHRGSENVKGVLTKKVLTAARNGSISAITLVGRTLEESGEHYTVEAIDSLLCHFRENAPTFNRTEISFDAHKDPAYKKHTAALIGISALHAYKDAINTEELGNLLKTSWQNVFLWVEFLYASYSSKQPSAQGQNDEDSLPHLLMGSFLTFLRVDGELSPHFVTQTPGAMRMTTQLWIHEGLDPGNSAGPRGLDLIQDGTIAFYLALGPEPTIEVLNEIVEGLNEVVEGANIVGQGLSIPSIWQARFRSSFGAGGEPGQATYLLVDMLTRLTVVDFTHRLQDVFLSHGTLPLMINCLSTTGARLFSDGRTPTSITVNSVLPIILPGFRYISCMFHVTPDIQWILQAIDAGFLELFVRCSPMFPIFPVQVQEIILECFFTALSPTLIHLPVILALADAMKRLKVQKADDLIRGSTSEVKRAWRTVVETVAKRLKVALATPSQPFRRKYICDYCCKVDSASTFKLCAGCGRASYCSKECQVKGWKERKHREQCNALKQWEGITGKDILTESRSRAAISPSQVDIFVRDVARVDAHENLETLRNMAKSQLPGVHIEDVGVIVDYSETPPAFDVFPRPECIGARQDRERGVVREIVYDFPPASRERSGEKLWRADENVVQFEIYLRRGLKKFVLSVGVLRFWDGLGSLGLQLDVRSDELELIESMLNNCSI
ncbi:hypothetical protein SCHPADRAFT_928299 [Schizopora paradoxa]|uniref:MYND-type domain-containing protein n=1 Tax=Schizopora paradoxa TaxID=27342 RepID=A0A0H2SA51_9AGAM|nr:hypothetical protein SCHPADRAFT_928299 [Schizopora paradoxa]